MLPASSIAEILESQDRLIQEAALALPHEFSRCTYPLGPLRQAVYLCLTCALPRGICSSCSIACHTDHEQIELFPKRHFRCDCPTSALPHPCTLHKHQVEEENTTNAYGQNFRAAFCHCGRPYDAKTERETMIQCVACEDWFHESCLNLRERPPPELVSESSALGDGTKGDASNAHPARISGDEDGDGDDAHSDASSSDLPPPLITAEDYESLICASCVMSVDSLRRIAGTKGAMMVIRDKADAPRRILDGDSRAGERPDCDNEATLSVDADDSAAMVGSKRSRSSSVPHVDAPDAKKPRPSPSPSPSPPCLAPASNQMAEAIFSALNTTLHESSSATSLGRGDVFLTEGWRDRWCRCTRCLPSLSAHPYLLEEEETYEPPEDPDSGLSLEELGLRALQRLPRERAIDGIRAFNDMRDDLMAYLRPFAQEGKVVGEADVTAFFETLNAGKRS
ncbi:hypothetical protein BJ138DRAFT_1141652 [Hygrophoropsis aurantiaca]|uniref:Uncharacterized protein n=1 Tax=Hygrophoropsis aurantiaca TaxID=72124 RepID=A0ACB8AQE5_9AGAM|nr:hypothetical protein BJ138DRAFT_1141652 [Hygrophoropsis aurantiaca]